MLLPILGAALSLVTLSCATTQPDPSASHFPNALPTNVVRMAVIGDFGSGSEAELSVANLIKSWNPDFILTLGDNNYPDGKADTIDQNIGMFYSEYISPYTGAYGTATTDQPDSENRFFPALGNHDWRIGNCDGYLDYFTLPGNERYYEIRRGPVAIFVIDSDPHEPDGNTLNSTQADWLEGRMKASDATFKLVTMHHPPYSSGPHGVNTSSQWPFAEWGADAVLGGHDHIYERLVIQGIPYIVNGIGGSWLYDFEQILDGSQVRFNSSFGALMIEASESTLTLQMVTADGGIVDTLNIPADGLLNDKGEALIDSNAEWTDKIQPSPSHIRVNHTFHADSTQSTGNLIGEIRATDGFVISINETEVWRQNLPAGTLSEQTRALSPTPSPTPMVQNSLSAGHVIEGENSVTIDLFTAEGSAVPPSVEFELFQYQVLTLEP
jgi:tartrate-resistant acid phosphatase type 5